MRYAHDKPLRVITLCAGYDSQCLALDRIKELNPEFDYDLVAWSEIDKYAIEAHNALFPQWADRNLGDMTKIDWEKVPDFDLLFYSTPCFVAGTKVLTGEGEKNIEDVRVGDMVLTHRGRYRKVLNTGCKWNAVFNLSTCPFDVPEVTCTANHPFWAKRSLSDEPDWVRADKLVDKEDITNSYYIAFVLDDGDIQWWQVEWFEAAGRALVFNLEVEDDNSYTANRFIVHNCQSISQAGLQHGFTEGSGTRSSIIWNVRDALRVKRPRMAILENVRAMVSSKFVGMFNLWQQELEKFGYTNFAKVLNAKDYGVPQNRERIFLVSLLDGRFEFGKPFKLEKRLVDLLEDRVDEKYYLDDGKVQAFLAQLPDETLAQYGIEIPDDVKEKYRKEKPVVFDENYPDEMEEGLFDEKNTD